MQLFLALLPFVSSSFAAPLALQERTIGRKLNSPLVLGSVGDVYDLRLTPDGSRVVYFADNESDGVKELFSRPLDLGAPLVKLNGPLPAGGSLVETFPVFGKYEISPIGPRVVYLADQFIDDKLEILSVLADGSAPPVQLNGALPPGGDVLPDFRISPDGTRVVFVAHSTTTGIYSAPIDGGAPPVLLMSPVSASTVFEVSADSVSVVFDSSGLFSAPIDGSSAPVPLGAPGGSDSFRISPTSDRVAFLSNKNLYEVPLDGSAAPVQLNDPVLVSQGAVREFGFSPDGSRVVFTADLVVYGALDLYSAPADGSASSVRLDAPGTAIVTRWTIDPGSTTVVFHESLAGKLLAAPLAGGASPILLAANVGAELGGLAIVTPGPLVVFPASGSLYIVPMDASAAPARLLGTNGVADFVISPDQSRAVFVRHRTAVPDSLHSVPLDRSAPAVRLNGPLVPFFGELGAPGGFARFAITSDSSRVVYLANEVANDVRVQLVPIDASAPSLTVTPGGPIRHVGDVHGFRYSPDGAHIVYSADQDRDRFEELYSVRPDGGSTAALVFPRAVVPGFPEPRPFELSADSRWVVGTDSDGAPDRILRSAEVDRPGSSIELFRSDFIEEGPSSLGIGQIQVTPDSRSILFLAHHPSPDIKLLALAIDGSGSPIVLSGSVGLPTYFRIGPGGQRIYFASGSFDIFTNQWELFGLYSVNQSLSVTQLNPPLGAGERIREYQVSTEGRVVYLGNLDFPASNSLYSVAGNGGGPTVRLADDSLEFFAPQPAGTRVVFSYGELFSVPVAGGAPPLQLSAGSTHAVFDFRFSPDGNRLVYQNASSSELFEVPVDGSQPARRVNADLVPGGDVLSLYSYPYSPDGRTIVYVADQDLDDAFDLYGADGTAAPVRLSVHRPGLDVQPDFAVSPDGKAVVYRADQDTDEVLELYVVPLDGSAAPRKLNAPLVAGGDVLSFTVSPDGQSVAYLADQDQDEAVELYSSALTRRHAPAGVPTHNVSR